MKKYFWTVSLCISYLCTIGQIAHQHNAWYMYFGNHKLTDKVGLHTEYQYRRSGWIKDWQQSLARIGIDYYLPNGAMATTGYGHIVSFPYGSQPIATSFTEHRIWQQFVSNQQWGRFYLNHRYRLEQRFLQDVKLVNDEKVIDGYLYRNRFRYRAMVSIPLNHKELTENTLFVALYNEVFIGFGKGIKANVLDQNRLFGALGYRFDKNTNIQLGYLYHRVFKADGVRREYNATFQIAVTKNFDFRKSE